MVMVAEAGWPCEAWSEATTTPMLPAPEPPYSSESVLTASRQTPVNGRPIRYPLCGFGEKFSTQATTEPSAPHRRYASTLPSRSFASSQVNPGGVKSCEYSAGLLL